MVSRGGTTVYDGIGPVLSYMVGYAVINVTEAMMSGKQEVEAYAKMNAPWSDRTGQARNGLTASVYSEGGIIVLELAHTAEHGLWLEVMQNGTFAIIMPTLEALGPQIIRDAGGRVMETGSTF